MSPAAIRGTLVSLKEAAIVLGISLGYGVGYAYRDVVGRPGGSQKDGSRRGDDADSPWRRVAATPRLPRGYSEEGGRGEDAAKR